jgi:hypothetical protein
VLPRIGAAHLPDQHIARAVVAGDPRQDLLRRHVFDLQFRGLFNAPIVAAPVGSLFLVLLFPGVLGRFVMANGAADCGSQQAVMMGEMAGCTADNRTFDAALGFSRAGRTGERKSQDRTGEDGFHGKPGSVA